LRAASIEPKPIDDVTARMADAQGRFDIIRRRLRRFFRRDCRRLLLCVGRLKRANIRFWVTAAAILIAVEWATPYIEASLHLTNVKNWLFRTLAESVTNPPRFRDVRLVMIGDDEFWDGDLHHRSPTDRSYLARLVRALDIADASVIALDFDMRLPHPEVAVSPGDYPAVDAFQPYRDETNELIRAVDDVAQRRSIVLSKRIDGPIEGPFEMRSDIYQPYGMTLWQKIGAVLGAMLLLLVSQWVTLQLFGTFFDAFVLVFALGLHAIIDRLIGEPQDTTAE
jgi:hypothetical protein